MAWSKFSPNEPPVDPMQATSEEAARRAWLLKWGWLVSQGMFVLGIILVFYWGFVRK